MCLFQVKVAVDLAASEEVLVNFVEYRMIKQGRNTATSSCYPLHERKRFKVHDNYFYVAGL